MRRNTTRNRTNFSVDLFRKAALSMKLECERLMKLARTSSLGVLAAAVALTVGCSASGPGAFAALDADLPALAQAHHEHDAVIMEWDQAWMIREDGSISRRDRQLVLINDVRAIDHFADPRIDYNADYDEVVIHTAQTHLPDGTIMPVPDYSFNLASPGDVGGWPAYAAWRQDIISFSGIVVGCVLELDYEIVSKPLPVLGASADLRLHHPWPTLERTVSVTCPASMELAWLAPGEPSVDKAGGMKTYGWELEGLAASWDEPQAPDWRQRGGRLAFTTCTDAATWVWPMLDAVQNAHSDGDAALEHYVAEKIKNAETPKATIDAVVGALNASFTLLDSYKTMHGLPCRSTAETFQANYGNPLEAGALLIAMLKAAGVDARPVVAVDEDAWNPAAPVDSAFSAVLAEIEGVDDVRFVHPRHGIVTSPGDFGGRVILALDSAGALVSTPMLDRGDIGENAVVVAGDIAIGETGAEGELRLTLSGAFFDADDMTDADQQAKAIERVVKDLLPGFSRTSHTIVKLDDSGVEAVVQVSAESLKDPGAGMRMLTFGAHALYDRQIPIPLNRSSRTTELEIRAPFTERVDLTIELSKEGKFVTSPQSLHATRFAWGSASLDAEMNGQSLHITREITVNADRIAPGDYGSMRTALADLLANGRRRVLISR
jgi:hypothetical protein